ncbi:hypothetical protein B0T11DRAFT_341331 [Plectosphaerella cucumerina]|uniref:Nuclear membrane fusion protein Kar5 n=1 Tax=Plectosphaerella cucumerina TaxID=40658 RepID=A0A8K0TCQ6_9PEZI|nr:hypothetical protein B0T11DRAFT_341331 [Plectosphaerella cucumerina]
MNELQELQSEPLCHRIAARLLVNNCQLLEGKDEATVLTDSGRQVRDFVDAYAASLAICDLQRGNFNIAPACAKFREEALAAVSDSKEARLHVSTREIDSCLTSMGKSDSAWNTWVSYRHKALRFCEAARADNEKAQSVRLYQRLTEILSHLTEGVEQELEQNLKSVETRVREATGSLNDLESHVGQLRDGLDELEDIISKDLQGALRDSADSATHGLQDVRSLQHLINLLMQTVLENNAAVSASHELSVQSMSQKTNQDMMVVMSALAAVAQSTSSLQNEMAQYQAQSTEIAQRQDQLSSGLDRLLSAADNLSGRLEHHADIVDQAQGRSDQLLNTLEEAAVSATTVKGSMIRQSGWTSWWPYVLCPTASLVMGSYGLPPSAFRNLALITLGELAGVAVSFGQKIPFDLFTFQPALPELENATTTFRTWGEPVSMLASNADLRHRSVRA